MNPLEKMKLVSELNKTVITRNAEKNPLEKMKLVKWVIDLRQKLGLIKNKEQDLQNQDEKEIDVTQLNTDISDRLETQTLFEAVKSYFRDKLQGKFVNTQIGKVWLIGGSWREMKKGMKKDEIKANLIPFVPQILNGRYDGKMEPKKVRNDEFSEFHSFSDTVKLENLGIIVNARIIVIKNPTTQQYEFYAYSLHYDGKNKESYQIKLDSSQLAGAATQEESPDYTYGINTTLILNDIQDGEWNIEIISITDLSGNAISLED